VQRDVFALIWIAFIVVIVILTFYGKEYIKDMIIVSIIFLAIFILEPLVKMSHSNKLVQFISRGKPVKTWKRFPIFFMAILIVFTLKHFLEIGLEESLPLESINIILVLFWLLSLFFLYYMIFSKQNEKKTGKSRGRKKVTYHK
jgi:hypothetical protein